MKDEIKVNKANKSITFINNGIAFSQFGVADEILDLITNLQEENESLKDYLKIMEKGKDNNLNRFLDYKSRNEKAIEYIKSLCYIESRKEWFTYGDDLSPEHIVNILQGGDNNDK